MVEAVLHLPKRLYDWVLAWADSRHAVAALFLLSFAEASFFPIPPDVLLIAMCLGARRLSLRFAMICTLASVAGGMFGYWIGAAVWGQVSDLFFNYVPGFKPEKFASVQDLYNEYGVLIVFTAGFTPIPFKIFTITSGVMDQALLPFLGASAIGRGMRFFLVAGLIYRYGEPVRALIDKYFNQLALAFTALLIGGFAALKWLF